MKWVADMGLLLRGGIILALAGIEDELADLLNGGLDLLHATTDAGASGLVPALGLLVIILVVGDELLEFVVEVH